MTGTYRNPVLPGVNPDPSITYVPGKGYYLCTSTFEYFPGLPIYHSEDTSEWKLIGHAINRRSQGIDMRTVDTSAGLWAPTIRYHKGRFYVACTCFYKLGEQNGKPVMVDPTGFYVSTDDIHDDSKWSDAVYFDELGFDQDLLFDDDDRTYLTTTRFDLSGPDMKIISYSNEIDLGSGRSITAPRLTLASDLGTAEGCHIIKRDGWYYLFSAEGGTQDGHQECVYRSRQPLGPWQSPPDGINPIIFNADHPDIQNTGHLDMVEGVDGQCWAVFLGVQPQFTPEQIISPMLMKSALGRQTFKAPVEWIDGWPVVNGRKPIELVGSHAGATYVKPTGWKREFASGKLDLDWYTICTPLRPFHSLTERQGYLAIRGSAYALDYNESPSALLLRQPDFDGDFSTEMEFSPDKPGQAAGITVWLSNKMHASLALTRNTDGKLEMLVRAPSIGEKKPMNGNPFSLEHFSIQESRFTLKNTPTALTLGIKCRKDAYELWYRVEGETITAGNVPAHLFQPLFTGVHLGLFAQGVNGSPCLNSAYFKYAQWDIVEA